MENLALCPIGLKAESTLNFYKGNLNIKLALTINNST